MNEITITVNVSCPELTSAINNLAAAICGKTPLKTESSAASQPVSVPMSTETVVPTVPTVAPVNQQMPYQPTVAPVSTAPTTVPSYTIEQFQMAIAPLLDSGKVQQIQQLVQSFGVATLMDIPKERYGEFANGLRSLGGVL